MKKSRRNRTSAQTSVNWDRCEVNTLTVHCVRLSRSFIPLTASKVIHHSSVFASTVSHRLFRSPFSAFSPSLFAHTHTHTETRNATQAASRSRSPTNVEIKPSQSVEMTKRKSLRESVAQYFLPFGFYFFRSRVCCCRCRGSPWARKIIQLQRCRCADETKCKLNEWRKERITT